MSPRILGSAPGGLDRWTKRGRRGAIEPPRDSSTPSSPRRGRRARALTPEELAERARRAAERARREREEQARHEREEREREEREREEREREEREREEREREEREREDEKRWTPATPTPASVAPAPVSPEASSPVASTPAVTSPHPSDPDAASPVAPGPEVDLPVEPAPEPALAATDSWLQPAVVSGEASPAPEETSVWEITTDSPSDHVHTPAPAPTPAPTPSAAPWLAEPDPLLAQTTYLADSIDDWLQGPIEAEAEREAEDAWSTGTAITRRASHTAAPSVGTGTEHSESAASESGDSSATPATPLPRTRPAFRSELHGLRAVALGLVAVYHIWLGRVSGGVDVFLFLSAFFLTGTFVRRLESGRPLAIPRYWLHTFKRLLPPAAVTVLLVLIGTAALLPQSLWPVVMQQSGASMLYVQNFLLIFQETDYQARDAGASSPLQHFWSLSVQGQAFLLWPLLFLIAIPFAKHQRSVRRPLLLVMALIAIPSLIWSIICTQSQQPVAYFDTTTRLWEFAAGAMLALTLPFLDRLGGAARPEDDTAPRLGALRGLLGWAGIIGLLACGIVLNVSALFPGWIAIWPLAAAGAVVVAGHSGKAWGVDRLLSTRVAAFVGDISYALYLVHWPLLVMWLHHSDQERAGLLDGLVILAASVLLAWVLTRLVDAPIRHSAWLEARPWRALAAIAASIAMTIGAAGGWWASLASPQAIPPSKSTSDGGGASDGGASPDTSATISPDKLLPRGWDLASQWPTLPYDCTGSYALQPFHNTRCMMLQPEGYKAKGTLVVIGSSHSRQYAPALLDTAKKQGWQVITVWMDGCSLEKHPNPSSYCAGWFEHAMAYLDQVSPDAVLTTVTTTSATSNAEKAPPGMDHAVQAILDRGIDVLAVRDNPRWTRDMYTCAEEVFDRGGSIADADAACGADIGAKYAAGNKPLAPFATMTGADGARVVTVDPSTVICPDGRCSPIHHGLYVYMDDNHLTRLFVERDLRALLSQALTTLAAA